MGVVAVVDVVVAEERGYLTGRERSGGDGVVGGLPRARRAGAVHDRQAQRLETGQGYVALGGELVVDVGDGALHRVVSLALRVGRDRVHPRYALVAALDLVVLANRLGAVVREKVVEVAEVRGVDVGQGKSVAGA